MAFVFICDELYQKKVSEVLVNGEVPNYKITTITANKFLESGKLPEDADCVIIERDTWQKNFSMFRYFRLLPLLEGKKLAFVASFTADFKGRKNKKTKEFVIPYNINAEEAAGYLAQLQEFSEPAYVHQKSKAIA